MKPVESITELIGRTPLVQLRSFAPQSASGVELYGKLENRNPGASVKDRIGLAMIEAAEESGELQPGGSIVEATSGNTGIALAYIGAVKGYKVVLTMPDTMSIERRRLLSAYGAELNLTPGHLGMKGAVELAEEIVAERSGAVLMRQFANVANPEAHRQTTAEEIWQDLEGRIDIFVACVGTGGTLTGVGSLLKQRNKAIELVAVEPSDSPVLSGGTPGPHRIQGIGAGFVPEVLDRSLIDEVLQVKSEQAAEATRQLAKKEGILAGISAGANVYAAAQVAARPENAGKRIVTIICDTGERYLSTWLFDNV